MKRLDLPLQLFRFLFLLIISTTSLKSFAQPGSLDLTFNAADPGYNNPSGGANSTVNAIAQQADGKIIIGGSFTSYNGAPVNYLVRVNADGSRDASFNAGQTGPGNIVRTIAIQSNGKILIGGNFTSYNGSPVKYVIRLNMDGSPDATFDGSAAPYFNVYTICIQPDGKILVGANSRPPLSRLNPDGSIDASFHTNLNNGAPAGPVVMTISLQPDGKIIAGGDFGFMFGVSVPNFIRINIDGSRDISFNSFVFDGNDQVAGPNGDVYASAIQPDGKILIGGTFSTYASATDSGVFVRNARSIVRLKSDGSIDPDFNAGGSGLAGSNPIIQALSLQQDGKILFGGYFSTYNNSAANKFGRLSANGSLDNSFTVAGANDANAAVNAIAIQPDGSKTLIGGSFTAYNDIGRNRIARINNIGCTVGSISGPIRSCLYTVASGTSATYSITAPAGSTYAWTVSNPATMQILSGQGSGSIQLQYANNFTSGVVYVKVSNTACGFVIKPSISVNSNPPSTPGAITASSSSICTFIGTPNTISYKINKVSAATSYNWTAQAGSTTISHPNGPGINDTIINVSFANNFTSSQITVQSVNDCGASNTRTLNVNLAVPSAPASIAGPVYVCDYLLPTPVGAAAVYSVPNVAGVTYNWTIPAGAGSFTGQGTNSISFYFPAGFTIGSVSVTATNGCGTSAPKTLNVKASLPQTPGAITTANISACPNQVYTYSIAAIPANATSVLWAVPAGGTITAGQGTTTITVSYGVAAVTGYVSLHSYNTCGASTIRKIAVNLAACTPGTPFAKNTGIATNAKSNITKSSIDGMDVKIFPNPSANEMTLQVVTSGKEIINVRIFDIAGRFISEKKFSALQTIKLGGELGTGNYLVEIRQGDNVKTEKLIKL